MCTNEENLEPSTPLMSIWSFSIISCGTHLLSIVASEKELHSSFESRHLNYVSVENIAWFTKLDIMLHIFFIFKTVAPQCYDRSHYDRIDGMVTEKIKITSIHSQYRYSTMQYGINKNRSLINTRNVLLAVPSILVAFSISLIHEINLFLFQWTQKYTAASEYICLLFPLMSFECALLAYRRATRCRSWQGAK